MCSTSVRFIAELSLHSHEHPNNVTVSRPALFAFRTPLPPLLKYPMIDSRVASDLSLSLLLAPRLLREHDLVVRHAVRDRRKAVDLLADAYIELVGAHRNYWMTYFYICITK